MATYLVVAVAATTATTTTPVTTAADAALARRGEGRTRIGVAPSPASTDSAATHATMASSTPRVLRYARCRNTLASDHATSPASAAAANWRSGARAPLLGPPASRCTAPS